MKTSRDKINEIRAFYCAGETIQNLAEKFGVPLSNVKNWYWKQDWAEARKKYEKEKESALMEKLTEQSEKVMKSYFNFSELLSEFALCEAKEILKTNEPDKIDKLSKLASLVEKGSRIFKNASPDFTEKLIEKILRESKRIA